MTFIIFVVVAAILIFVYSYRKNSGQNVYKYISKQAGVIYEKYAPITAMIGDCTHVAQIGEAVRGGFFAGWSIH